MWTVTGFTLRFFWTFQNRGEENRELPWKSGTVCVCDDFLLIPKNVTRERFIALLSTMIRRWWWLRAPEVSNWQQRHRVGCDPTGGRNGGTVWETLLEMESFDYRAGKMDQRSVTLVLDLSRAFERVSLPVVWAWATHFKFPRKILRLLCGNFEHQWRVQFEGCVAERVQFEGCVELSAPSHCASRSFERSDEGMSASPVRRTPKLMMLRELDFAKGCRQRGKLRLSGGTHLVVILRSSLQLREVARAVRAQGFRAQAWDTILGAQRLNLCRSAVRSRLKRDIKLGTVLAVYLTPPSGATLMRAQRVALSLFAPGAKQGVPTALHQSCASLLRQVPTCQSFLQFRRYSEVHLDLC